MLLKAREAVRLVLEARFGRVTYPLGEQLRNVQDLDRLEQLLRLASTAASLAEFECAL